MASPSDPGTPGASASELSLKLLHLEAEAETLRSTAAETQSALDKANARASALEDVLEETETETVSLKARADEAAERARDAKDGLAQREDELALANEEKSRLEQESSLRVAELEGRLRRDEDELTTSRAANEELRQAAEALQKEFDEQIAAANASVAESEASAEEASIACRAATEEAAALGEQLREASEARSALETKLEEAAAEVEALTSRAGEKVAEAAEEIAKLTKLVEEKDAGAAEEIASLTKLAEEKGAEAAAELAKATEVAREKDAEAAAKIAALIELGEEKDAEVAAKIATLTTLGEEKDAEAAAKIATLTTLAEAKNAEAAAGFESVAKLAEEKDAEAAAKIAAAKERAEEKVAEANAEIASLTKLAEEKDGQTEMLRKSLQAVQDRAEQSEAVASELVQKQEQTAAELEEIATEREALEAELNDLTALATESVLEAQRDAAEEMGVLQHALDVARSDLNASEAKLAESSAENAAERERLSKKLTAAESHHDESVRAVEQQIEVLARERDELVRDCDELSKSMQEADSTIAARDEIMRSLEEQLAVVVQDRDELAESKKEAASQHEANVRSLEQDISVLTTERDALSASKEEGGTTLQLLTSQVATLEAESAAGKDRLASSADYVEVLTQRLQILEETNFGLQKNIQESGSLLARVEVEGVEMSKKTKAAIASAEKSRAAAIARADAAEKDREVIVRALQSVHAKLVTLSGLDTAPSLPEDLAGQLESLDDAATVLESLASTVTSLGEEKYVLTERKAELETANNNLQEKCQAVEDDAQTFRAAALTRAETAEERYEQILRALERLIGKLFMLSGVDTIPPFPLELSGKLECLDDAVAKIESRTSALSSLEDEKESLTEAKAVLETANRNLESKCQTVEEDAQTLRAAAITRAETAEEGFEDIVSALENLNGKLFRLSGHDTAPAFPQELSGKLECLDSAVAKLESRTSTVSCLEEEKQLLTDRNSQLKIAITELEEKCETAEADKAALASEAESHRRSLEELVNEAKTVSEKHAVQKKEILKLRQSLRQLEEESRSALEQQHAESWEELKEQEHATEITLSNLQATQAKLEAAVDEKVKELEEMQTREDETARAHGEVLADKDSLEDKVADKSVEILELNEKLELHTAEAHETVERLQKQIENMESVRASETTSQDKLIQDAEAEAEHLQGKCAALERDLDAVRDEFSAAEEQRVASESNLHTAQMKLASLLVVLSKHNEKIANLEQQRRVGAEQASQHQMLVDNADAEIARLKSEMETTKQELEDGFEKELQLAEETMIDAAQQHEQARDDLEKRQADAMQELREAVNSSEIEITRLKREAAATKQNLEESFEKELQLAEKAMLDAAQEHVQARGELEKRHALVLQEVRETADKSSQVWQEERVALCSRIELLEGESDGVILRMAQLKENTESQVRTLDTQLENAVASTGKLQTERDMLQKDLEDLQLSSGDLKQQVSAARQETESSAAACKSANEKLARSHDAIAALETQVVNARAASGVADEERLEQLSRIQSALASSKEKEAVLAHDLSKARQECNAATSRLGFVESKIVKDLEDEIGTLRSDEGILRKAVGEKENELSNLKDSVARLEEGAREMKELRERLRLADDALAAKDASAEQRKQASDDQAMEIDRFRVNLKERETSLGDMQARMLTLESDSEAQRESLRVIEEKLADKTRVLSETEASLLEATSKLNQVERDAVEEGAKEAATGEGKSEELFDALEKYDDVLEKMNRLRKRAKRFEALLAMERKKNTTLATAAKLRNAEVIADEDRDTKRQVSPSTKGMSPSVKRARDAAFRTPLSPLATNNRPPLGPRSRQ